MTAKLEILGLPNVAHATGANVLQDLVMADGLADQTASILALSGLDSVTW